MPLISLYSIWECLHPFNPVPPQKVMAAKRTLILLFFLWQPLVLFNTHNSNTHQWLTSQLFYNCEELSPLFVYAHRIRSSFVLLFNFYFASTLHLPSSTASYCRPGRQRFRCLAEVVLFGLRPVGPTVGVLSRWSEGLSPSYFLVTVTCATLTLCILEAMQIVCGWRHAGNHLH